MGMAETGSGNKDRTTKAARQSWAGGAEVAELRRRSGGAVVRRHQTRRAAMAGIVEAWMIEARMTKVRHQSHVL